MRIQIDGQSFADRLEALRQTVLSDRPLNAIIQEMRTWVEQNYIYHGQILDSVKWRPNSPKWIEHKREMHGSLDPGVFYGYLAKSFQSDDAIQRYDAHHATYGTRTDYADEVNAKRPILGSSPAYHEMYKEAFLEALQKINND